MRQLWRYAYALQDVYDNEVDQQRGQTVLTFVWLVVAYCVLWFVVSLPQLATLTTFGQVVLGVGVFLVAALVLSFVAVKGGRLTFASNWTVAVMTLASIVILYSLPTTDPRFILILLLPVMLAGVLLDRFGIFVVGFVLTGAMILTGLLSTRELSGSDVSPFPTLTQLTFIVLLATTILSLYASSRQRTITQSAAEVEQLRGIMESVTQITPETTEVDVLQRAIRFLRGALDYDFVRIYLLDGERLFSQRIQSGERELTPLRGDEALRLGGTTAIAEAARFQLPVSVMQGTDSPDHLKHLLPSIRHGIVIPIIHDNAPLGVIDLQSVNRPVSAGDDVQLVTTLADQLGSALNLLSYVRSKDQELAELTENSKRIQSQLARLQQPRVTDNDWDDYTNHTVNNVIGFDMTDGMLQPAGDLPESLKDVLKRGETTSVVEGTKRIVYVPIRLRDDVLGAMTFEIPTPQPLTDRQQELINTVADRLGSTLERTRLLEQTQAQATRERKASEVANALITATDIDGLLYLATETFNDALGAVQTQIYIEPHIGANGKEDGGGQ